MGKGECRVASPTLRRHSGSSSERVSMQGPLSIFSMSWQDPPVYSCHELCVASSQSDEKGRLLASVLRARIVGTFVHGHYDTFVQKRW